jgi:hypothetical protein
MDELSQTEQLVAACEDNIGVHYESPEWTAVANDLDWENHWPVVDGDGLLTGDVYESGDGSEGWANVDDVAMVRMTDLPPEEQASIRREQRSGIWDGHASVPGPATDD